MSHQWKWPTTGRLAIGPSMGATSAAMAKTAVFRLAASRDTMKSAPVTRCGLSQGRSGFTVTTQRKLPVVALTGMPMASPETTSSTLRFCWRPAGLSLEVTGKVLPKPDALTEFAATPCSTR